MQNDSALSHLLFLHLKARHPKPPTRQRDAEYRGTCNALLQCRALLLSSNLTSFGDFLCAEFFFTPHFLERRRASALQPGLFDRIFDSRSVVPRRSGRAHGVADPLLGDDEIAGCDHSRSNGCGPFG